MKVKAQQLTKKHGDECAFSLVIGVLFEVRHKILDVRHEMLNEGIRNQEAMSFS